MFLFCRGEMPSLSSPSPGEPTTVVVVVLRGEEYHVPTTDDRRPSRDMNSRLPKQSTVPGRRGC
jgi:hypothetical protein